MTISNIVVIKGSFKHSLNVFHLDSIILYNLILVITSRNIVINQPTTISNATAKHSPDIFHLDPTTLRNLSVRLSLSLIALSQ